MYERFFMKWRKRIEGLGRLDFSKLRDLCMQIETML